MNAPTSISTTEEKRKTANLRVLQRLDGSIDDIVGSATYVVVYEFKQQRQGSSSAEGSIATAATNNNTAARASDGGEWEKCDIEGSLFITCTREKSYKLIVLNRNSTRNMVVSLENFQISSEKPFIIFRSSNKNKIHGIWFHKDEERSATYDLMARILVLTQEAEHQNSERNSNNKGNTASAKVETSSDGLAEGIAASLLISPLKSDTLATQKQQHHSTPVDSSASQPPMMLDKKNLQLTLLSLIQDERFIDLIHAQYVKIVQARGGNSSNK